MFGRSSSSPDPSRPSDMKPNPAPAGSFIPPKEATTPLVPPSFPAAGQGSELPTSVIGKDLHIGGEKIIIVCESRLQVDGEIVGDLASREVIIGKTATVTGSIAAESIEVLGKVNGEIKGMKVALKPSAQVDGDIVHQTLTIEEGAQFDGRVRRAKEDREVQPILALPT